MQGKRLLRMISGCMAWGAEDLLPFPSGIPEALGWVSELLARLGLVQTRLWEPADGVLAGE